MDCSIFQSNIWEDFKLKTGYHKSFRVSGILILQKSLPLGKTLLYSPMVSQEQFLKIKNSAKIRNFIEDIKDIGRANNSVFYRLELNIPWEKNSPYAKLLTPNFVKSFEEMQPEHNWILNISRPEDQLLAEMKQKGRYNIKIAEKGGVTISSSGNPGRELDEFYEQYSKTGKRHRISYRGKSYFEALLEILGKSGYAKAYVAYAGKTALASAIILFYGSSALYLYGGSSEEKRNLMAPYLLHWAIIKEAKEKGLAEYNFLGVAENENPKHPWAGITRFKKQFGGQQVDILGSYDLPLKPVQYQAFKLAEKIRRR